MWPGLANQILTSFKPLGCYHMTQAKPIMPYVLILGLWLKRSEKRHCFPFLLNPELWEYRPSFSRRRLVTGGDYLQQTEPAQRNVDMGERERHGPDDTVWALDPVITKAKLPLRLRFSWANLSFCLHFQIEISFTNSQKVFIKKWCWESTPPFWKRNKNLLVDWRKMEQGIKASF